MKFHIISLTFFTFQHSGSILRNACVACKTALRHYQENVTTGQTHRQTPDKVIPMCRYASQATQKCYLHLERATLTKCFLSSLKNLGGARCRSSIMTQPSFFSAPSMASSTKISQPSPTLTVSTWAPIAWNDKSRG